MLLLGLPYALTVPCDERHEYQSQVTQMIGEVLGDYGVFWEQKVADSKANVTASAKKTEESMKEVEESIVKVKDQEEEITKRKDALQGDSEAVKTAEVGLESASKEVVEFDTNLQVTIAEKEQCQSSFHEHFTLAKSGVDDAKEMARLLKEVQQTLKKICTESSLLNALVPALKKSPEARGSFGVMVIEQVEAIFSKHLDELKEKIDKADVTKAEKINTETMSQEALKTAMEKCTASEEALKSAEKELACLKTTHRKLLMASSTADEESNTSESVVVACESRLSAVQLALSTYTELFERKSSMAESCAVEDKLEVISESIE